MVQRIGQLVSRAASGIRSALGIDAVDQTKHRRTRTGSVKSVDAEVDARKRKVLTLTARDVNRNFGIAAWAIRKHLDFVSSFNFQTKTADVGFNREVEAFMQRWSRPENCDVGGRHPLRRIVRLAEACRVIDSDVLLVKLSSGRLQAIEGDRIVNPRGGLVTGNFNRERVIHGVDTTPAGRAKRYAIHRRRRYGGLEFERWLPARHVIHHAWFADRFDQVRGLSPITATLNQFQDVYENFDYALAKSKVAQLFGIAFYRDAVDGLGELSETGVADGDDPGEAAGYDVKLGTRPLVLDLEPGDKAEFLENKTPSPEFQSFTVQVIGAAIKALDLPMSFYDESFTNFFGSKSARSMYLKSASEKRRDVQELLRKLTVWRLALAVDSGDLILPSGIDSIEDIAFEWIPTGMPWFDEGKEIRADVMAVHAGLRTRTEIRRERFGDSWEDVISRLKEEQDFIETSGVAITAPGPSIYNPEAVVHADAQDNQ